MAKVVYVTYDAVSGLIHQSRHLSPLDNRAIIPTDEERTRWQALLAEKARRTRGRTQSDWSQTPISELADWQIDADIAAALRLMAGDDEVPCPRVLRQAPGEGWVRLEKQCQCSPATASGPRLVITQVDEFDTNNAKVTFAWHEMVCDVCQTPWARTAEKRSDRCAKHQEDGGC